MNDFKQLNDDKNRQVCKCNKTLIKRPRTWKTNSQNHLKLKYPEYLINNTFEVPIDNFVTINSQKSKNVYV